MCYAVPLAGAIITSGIWKKTKNIKIRWLNLMFYGGALFGVVDHLWNKELFLISDNFASDILLGFVISAVTVVVWVCIVAASSKKIKLLKTSNLIQSPNK
ncbi:MAG: hypothetical protein ABH872_06240 [Candidatus Omnitrophota bacterium]